MSCSRDFFKDIMNNCEFPTENSWQVDSIKTVEEASDLIKDVNKRKRNIFSFGFKDDRLNNYEFIEKLINKTNIDNPILDAGYYLKQDYPTIVNNRFLSLHYMINNLVVIETIYETYYEETSTLDYKLSIFYIQNKPFKLLNHHNILGIDNILEYIECSK